MASVVDLGVSVYGELCPPPTRVICEPEPLLMKDSSSIVDMR